MTSSWLRILLLTVILGVAGSDNAEARRRWRWWQRYTPPPTNTGGGGSGYTGGGPSNGIPAVPEPATALLMGTGIVAIAYMRRRRKSQDNEK